MICASYSGHFRHANSWHLREQLRARYPWLRTALHRRSFDHRLVKPVIIPIVKPEDHL